MHRLQPIDDDNDADEDAEKLKQEILKAEEMNKIVILGKGAKHRDGKEDDEPLHAYVTSTNPEAVKKAVDKIRNIIKEKLSRLSHLQLQELANLNEVNDKVMIPQEIDFVGLIIGPFGRTLKTMESETACVGIEGTF